MYVYKSLSRSRDLHFIMRAVDLYIMCRSNLTDLRKAWWRAVPADGDPGPTLRLIMCNLTDLRAQGLVVALDL